ncbi:MAG TPA: hypothetical protein VIK11_13800 [Tepidiformaceae bacterium]
MIVLLEEPEAWSLMMLVSALAVDNADISTEGKEAIRKWRSERSETSAEIKKLTDAVNTSLNRHIEASFMRRVKMAGGRADTVKK